jgi:hypothetical protein
VDAMQYDITLPADYDLDIIRHRVATRGTGTDAFPGLALKAYTVREKGVDGSPVNQYAPFYLWAEPAGMKEFLFGPGFAGLVADFGRPPVRHWTGVALRPGPDRDGVALSAGRRITRMDPAVPLSTTMTDAVHQLDDLAATAGVHTAAVVVDLASWELLHFTLWAQPVAPEGPGERYRVLHTSTPQLADLRPGRQW